MRMSVDLKTNYKSLIAAWEEVRNTSSTTTWILYGYEGQSYVLKFIDKGCGGLEEIGEELNAGKILYAICRVTDPNTTLPKLMFINWGEGVPALHKGLCANHLKEILNLFQGIHITVTARNEEDIEPSAIMEKLMKSTVSKYDFKKPVTETTKITPVGTTYQRTIPSQEINQNEINKFWIEQHKQENSRIQEEKMKKQKENERLELERIKRENEESRLRNEKLGIFTSPETLKSKYSAKETAVEKSQSYEPVVTQNASDNILLKKKEPQLEQPINNSQLLSNTEGKCETNLTTCNESRSFEHRFQLTTGQGLRARALYDYSAGDVITHVEQIHEDWWQGIAPNRAFGLFPANYVELLD